MPGELPLVVVLDGGSNRRGYGATVVNVSQALYDEGVTSVRDFSALKGKKFGVPAAGSVNQYSAARTLIKAKLDPAKDVEWVMNVAQPDLARMLGRNEVAATDLDYRFGLLAQNNRWGPIIISDDQMVPDTLYFLSWPFTRSFLPRSVTRSFASRWRICVRRGNSTLQR